MYFQKMSGEERFKMFIHKILYLPISEESMRSVLLHTTTPTSTTTSTTAHTSTTNAHTSTHTSSGSSSSSTYNSSKNEKKEKGQKSEFSIMLFMV